MPKFPATPPELKFAAHFLKVADEHDDRNVLVSYWARMHACQVIMKQLPGKKSPEVSSLLIAILDWLEETKKTHHDTEGISDETTAHALIEQYAIQLFQYADAQDREANFNKNTVKAFYTAGILMDILEQFGEVSEDIFEKRKYAKWKAAHIHNCLKNGEIPTPGGPQEHKKNVTKKGGGPVDEESEGGDVSADTNDDDTFTSNNYAGPSTPDPVTPSLPAPIAPAPASSPITPTPISTPRPLVTTGSGASLGPDVIEKAQKYCKYATSALTYDDVPAAVNNLVKALNLLQTGKEEL